MSKTLRTVAVIAGAVALVATGVGAAAGAGLIGTAGATAGAATVAGISASTLATVGAIASVASTVASIGAQLTAKKPPARGSVNQVLIASDAPAPYLIGRTFFGGVLRYDRGYGATLKKVPNPYRAMVLVYSVAGPLQGLEAPYMDFAPVTINSGGEAVGYYNQFLNFDYRVGNDPDSALIPHHTGLPGWSSAHKLSSKACALWNLKFDKDGKRFASGVPSLGAVWNGVKVYDPRLDSTYPGGSGSQRINNEATWGFAGNENPGLNGLAYALGRYRNGKKVFGVGLPAEGIVIADFVTLANVCDANGWKVGGVLFEPGDKWTNLKEILQAGGAEPGFVGGKLALKINAPRVALDTITAADLADEDAETVAMQSWRNRLNGIIPKYRSEANKWEYVSSDLVSVSSYVTQDGEEKNEERQYNLVQQKNQAAQLAAYELVNGRELSPITLVCKPRLRKYGMGDMLTLNLPNDHGLDNVNAVIIDRSIDPATMKVTLTFMSETAGKHDFALGRTGTAPPTAALTSPQDRDDIAAEVALGQDGASAFTLVNLANTAIDVNSIEKNGGSSGAWDASAHSAERFVGGSALSFTLPQTNRNIFVGLNSDPTTDASYASIDYAFYFRADGTIAAWESGGGDVALGAYAAGDRFQITYDGANVRWVKNGSVLRTVSASAGLSFALDTSFLEIGGRIEGITWAAAGSVGTAGAPGGSYYTWIAYADSPDGSINFTTGAPGGRTYIGIASNQTSPTESGSPGAYIWSPYAGPPNFGLVAGANMIVSGARLFKSGGSYTWDSQVYSSESFSGGAFVAFKPEISDQMMIGLNTDPTANASYDSIDHAIYVSTGGYWDCRTNNGATILYAGSGWVLGDTFALHYRGNAIDFKKNGVTHHTIAAATGQTFWLDSSFTQQGHNATILAWAAAGAAGSDGSAGATGDPGYAIAPAASSLQVQCTSGGVPLSGQIPQSLTLTLLRGATDLSTDGATSFALIASDATSSFSFSGTNNRTVTVTGAPLDSFGAIIGAYRSGVLVQQHPISVRKVKNGAAAAADYRRSSSWTNASASSYGSAGSGSFEFSVGNTGNISFELSIAYYPSVSSGTMVAKVQERIFDSGTSTWGAWTDISSEFFGTLSAPGEPGEINVSFNHTITSASIRSYKVLTRRQSGSGALTTSGTFAGTYT